jgi:hypothetical protein
MIEASGTEALTEQVMLNSSGCIRVLGAAALALALAACGEDRPPAKTLEKAPPAPSAALKNEAPPAPAPAKAPQPDPNQALAAKVKQALEAERRVNAQGLEVSAKDGVVSLFGTVDSQEEGAQAGRTAAAVPGVRSVENRLVIVKGS